MHEMVKHEPTYMTRDEKVAEYKKKRVVYANAGSYAFERRMNILARLAQGYHGVLQSVMTGKSCEDVLSSLLCWIFSDENSLAEADGRVQTTATDVANNGKSRQNSTRFPQEVLQRACQSVLEGIGSGALFVKHCIL